MTTRKQQKHEMLLAFMANVNDSKPKRRVTLVRPKFISTLLSLFL